MNKLISLAAAGSLGLLATALAAEDSAVVTMQLPEENSRFLPGPGSDTAAASCGVCHSADYIYMQPPLTKEQWLITVTKMQKAFGAQIAEADIEPLVNYLVEQNGRKP